jgi:hypothetical protein
MNIFKTDKFPYLLTILIALAGWSLSRIIEKITEAPTIEYSVKTVKEDSGKKTYRLYIHNISKTLLKKMVFKISYYDSQLNKISNPNIITIPPAFKDDLAVGDDAPNNEYATYEINQMQPGWKYILTADIEGDDLPVFYMKSVNDETIRMKELGIETLLIRGQTYIIVGLFLIWSVLIVIYLSYISKAETAKKTEDNEKE